MRTGIVKFTEEQMDALIHDEWDGSGPCRLNEALTLADLAATSVVPNARILMADLDGAGAKLTAKGNLNRKLVESLAGRFQWEGYPPERVWSVNKVLNEDDYTPALYLHGVLKLAGVARTEKGFIKLTKKGKALLAEDALMRSVTMPSEEALNPRWSGAPVGAFNSRVLRYLRWFGLLEEKQAAANDDWRQPRLVRKTALYDRMLSFKI